MSSASNNRAPATRAAGDANTKRPAKASKPSKIVRLKLAPTVLSRLDPSAPSSQTGSARSDSPSSQTSASKDQSTADSPASTTVEPNGVVENEAKPEGTASGDANEGPKKKAIAGSKPGFKRGSVSLQSSLLRGKTRPGPKKRPRLEEITADDLEVGPPTKKGNGGSGATGTHKLGPKANQGAINAGLRALDRSGKPCRRWEKKTFQLKSFTGVSWEIPSWRSPKAKVVEVEDASQKEKVSQSGESDGKENKIGSDPYSEKSSNGADEHSGIALSNNASSPAPLVASPA